MQSISLLIRGSMVSLSTLALIAALASTHVLAEPQHMFASGPPTPRSGSWPPTGAHLPGGQAPAPAVPRGDLRSDIADNARQRTPPSRPEPAAQPRR
jgi:hypothetical protein